MISSTSKQSSSATSILAAKTRSYSEVVEFLDSRWDDTLIDTSKATITQLAQSLGNLADAVDTILVGGTNGKSLTANFIGKLLKEEGIKVGTLLAPHIMTYNERLSINGALIQNKEFTDVANTVINEAAHLKLNPHAYDILVAMGLLYFKKSDVNVAVLEVAQSTPWDPTTICTSKVTAITRVTANNAETDREMALKHINELAETISPDTWVVSGDQSKFSLQTIQHLALSRGGCWAMPIRKLAVLDYPFEQLHGRCAALAERAAQIYAEYFTQKKGTTIANSLLIKPKGQRGRPTLEAKRHSELNPKRTVENFWSATLADMPGRFELLDKDKPTVLLDNASNLDALNNLLLGVRLLHYQKPLKGLSIVLGCENGELDSTEFLKTMRYFFKKTSGQLILCPVSQNTVSHSKDEKIWNAEAFTTTIKAAKIPARVAANFAEAFKIACDNVDDRDGLVVITGSRTIITEYWRHKEVKKLS